MPFNIPILLTWFRVVLIPIFAVLFYLPSEWLASHYASWIGAGIFAFACATDWLDGYLARRWHQTSRFGAFLDPVADKLIVATALILLVDLGRTYAIYAIIIIGREITISALREWMAQIGQSQNVAVAYVGKLKTVAQMIAITLLLIGSTDFYGIDLLCIGNGLMVLAVILTLWSMFYYLKVASKHFSDEKPDLKT